jgi:hypothetical protein
MGEPDKGCAAKHSGTFHVERKSKLECGHHRCAANGLSVEAPVKGCAVWIAYSAVFHVERKRWLWGLRACVWETLSGSARGALQAGCRSVR